VISEHLFPYSPGERSAVDARSASRSELVPDCSTERGPVYPCFPGDRTPGRSRKTAAAFPYCGEALTKQQVLATIAEAFHFPRHFGKNFDALSDCLTSLVYKSGQQFGFLVVLEQLPNTQKFDREARETLLDVFRDAADFWAEKKVPFRVFYSFQ
jgi:RNAse (barnase) inhibitor barstar